MNFAKIFQLTPNVQVLAYKKDDAVSGTFDVEFMSGYAQCRAEITVPWATMDARDKFFDQLTLLDAQRYRLRMDEKVFGHGNTKY